MYENVDDEKEMGATGFQIDDGEFEYPGPTSAFSLTCIAEDR